MSCPRRRVYGCGGNTSSWSYSWTTRNGVTTYRTTGNVPKNITASAPAKKTQQSSGNTSAVTAKPDSSKDYHELGLNLHNWYRKRHGSPKMVLVDRLNQCADAYAYKLASQGRLVHTSGLDYNENLFMSSDTSASKKDLVRQACKAWYDEKKLYNFSNPGFSMQTGHFTAMVWKGSTQLGIGCWAAKGWVVVVACYKPHANFQGQFRANVLPWRDVEDSDDEREKEKEREKQKEIQKQKEIEKQKELEREKEKEIAKEQVNSSSDSDSSDDDDTDDDELDETAHQIFKEKANADGTIGWSELKEVLNEINFEKAEFKFQGFDKTISSLLISLITIREKEKSRIGVDEFVQLLQCVEGVLNAYFTFDKDCSGALDPFELKSALEEAGFNISYKTYQMLQKMFADDEGNMDFRGYVLCFILLSKLQIVQQKKTASQMLEDFSMKDWMEHEIKIASSE